MILENRIKEYESHEWGKNNIPIEERTICLFCPFMRRIGICEFVVDDKDFFSNYDAKGGYLKKYGCEKYFNLRSE